MDTSFILDCKGREILPGDTLKVFHFIVARRKRCYMYKYVEAVEKRPTWREGLDALRISHLNVEGGTWLRIRDGQVWQACEIVQGYGAGELPFDERPKREPAPKPEFAATH